MRYRNEAYKQDILEFVNRYYAKNGKTPGCRDIAANTKLQRSSVQEYLVAMDEQGLIKYNGQTIETPEIRMMRDGTRDVGIIGAIPCGIPEDAEEHLEGTVTLPLSLTGDGEVYILYANGESMIDAGIMDGDMVLVHKQETAKEGDIVVAWLEGEGNTLKRLIHKEDGIYLHPENKKPEYQDIPVKGKEFRIQGVALWDMTRL